MSLAEVVEEFSKPLEDTTGTYVPMSNGAYVHMSNGDYVPVQDFKIPKGKVFYVQEVMIPMYGKFRGKGIVYLFLIDKKEVPRKRKLRRRINQAYRDLNKKFLYPEKFNKPAYLTDEDTEGCDEWRTVKSEEYKRWERKCRTWGTLRNEYYQRNIAPLVKQFYRDMKSENSIHWVIDDPKKLRIKVGIVFDDTKVLG